MLYDEAHVFLNGEAWRVAGVDARWLRLLADRRCLSAQELAKVGKGLRGQLMAWCEQGWLQPLQALGNSS